MCTLKVDAGGHPIVTAIQTAGSILAGWGGGAPPPKFTSVEEVWLSKIVARSADRTVHGRNGLTATYIYNVPQRNDSVM